MDRETPEVVSYLLSPPLPSTEFDGRVTFPSTLQGEAVPALADLDLLQGTLDTLVLKALTREARHGYAVARWIRETTREELEVEEGALYTALHRMHRRGWIRAEWGLSENNRKAKYYSLTPAGRAQLNRGTEQLRRYSRAVTRVLEASA